MKERMSFNEGEAMWGEKGRSCEDGRGHVKMEEVM